MDPLLGVLVVEEEDPNCLFTFVIQYLRVIRMRDAGIVIDEMTVFFAVECEMINCAGFQVG